MFSVLERNGEKREVKLSLFKNFLIFYLLRYTTWFEQSKYIFNLKKCSSYFKNIFNSDKNVRNLSVYKN